MRVLLVALTCLAGCYRPADDRSCALRCTAVAECPTDFFACNHGFCARLNDTCASDGGVVAPDGSDGPADGPSLCFGSTGVKPCFDSAPTGTLPIMTAIDTSACTGMGTAPQTLPMAGDLDVCVISADVIRVAAVIRVTGSRPAVFVAVTRFEIVANGVVDVGSGVGTTGAGANAPACSLSSSGSGAVGAAGGSFVGRGGSSAGNALGPVGTAPAFRGGCTGGSGDGVAFGGVGGGAVFVIAGQFLLAANAVTGGINAGGGGGHGGEVGSGGGGGGSGGYIGIDSPSIGLGTGTLVASGGGGGGGGGTMLNGLSGGDADTTTPAALGGNAPVGAGAGGPGGSVLAGGTGGAASGMGSGDGGGGGGAGAIQFFDGTRACGGHCTPDVTPP